MELSLLPGLRVKFLLVLALEDVGYCTFFKRGHVFIYREGVDPVEPQLIGDQVDKLYMLRGQPSGYDSCQMRSMRILSGPKDSVLHSERREGVSSEHRQEAQLV
jgi:hypothetical protein